MLQDRFLRNIEEFKRLVIEIDESGAISRSELIEMFGLSGEEKDLFGDDDDDEFPALTADKFGFEGEPKFPGVVVWAIDDDWDRIGKVVTRVVHFVEIPKEVLISAPKDS